MRIHRPLSEALLGLLCFALALGWVVNARRLALAQVLPHTAKAAPTWAPPNKAQPTTRGPVVSYALQVTLNAEQHTLQGQGTIDFTNSSTVVANELYLHLYLNAFKNHKTLFQRAPFQGARSGRKASNPGHITVEKLVALDWDKVDLWPAAARHSPGDPDDETDIRVPLPRSLAPGEKLSLEVAWTAQLPSLTERTGYWGDFHMVAQWFPKLARLEPDGRWAHFAFHPQAEFYADFGNYEITLDVPLAHTVGATGELWQQRVSAERKILTYRATNVHDFAWTSWPNFLEHNEIIHATQVRVLYPKAARTLLDRKLQALRFGLAHFNRAYGQYPYPTLTVVHPPAGAEAAGGMEYPTLITTGGAVTENWVSRALELVTLHELAHQWFYGVNASNEAAAPFLDEGITSYAEASAINALWGSASGGKLWDLEVSADALRRAQAASAEHDDAVAAKAADFAHFGSLGALVYSRTATLLQTLAHVYGEETLQQALGEYSQRHRFAHPTAEDFISALGRALGNEAATALRTVLFERGWLDYSIESVQTKQEASSDDTSAREWIGEVLVRRHGTVVLPVDVLLIAADGGQTRTRWSGKEHWVKIPYRGRHPLQSAVVDPDLKLTLDSNLINNAQSRQPASTARSLERALYLSQLLLKVTSL